MGSNSREGWRLDATDGEKAQSIIRVFGGAVISDAELKRLSPMQIKNILEAGAQDVSAGMKTGVDANWGSHTRSLMK